MKKPLMIAHRGYSGFEKENTLLAFSAAGAIDEFYGIETDVHATKDNHYITIHDETTSRVTNDLINVNVEEETFENVRKIKLTDIDGSTNRIDIIIPEMIEYFKVCKKYHKVAVCELKNQFNEKQIKEIIDIVNSIDMLKNTIFISFCLQNLIIVKQISKDITCQLLLCEFKEEHIKTLLQYNLDVDVYYNNINKEQIKLCHDNNIKVNIWTVNDQQIANLYASYNVDYITTNFIKETF